MALVSCNSAKNVHKAISDIRFLEGTWESNDEDVTFQETWKYNDGKLDGTSILMLAHDTLYFENVSIYPINKKVCYHSTFGKYIVQENKKFDLNKSNKRKALFGDLDKFNTPYILYKKKGDNLLIEARDIIDGEIQQDKYIMKKIK